MSKQTLNHTPPKVPSKDIRNISKEYKLNDLTQTLTDRRTDGRRDENYIPVACNASYARGIIYTHLTEVSGECDGHKHP